MTTGHDHASLVPGPRASAHMVCDTCGRPFAAFPHPTEPGVWYSPDWEDHIRIMRRRRRRLGWLRLPH